MRPLVGWRWPLFFSDGRALPPNESATLETVPAPANLHVHRLLLNVRSRCPYLRVSRGYWDRVLRRALGSLRPRAEPNLLWDAFVCRFELAGHSQLALPEPVTAALFGVTAVGACVTYSGLPKGGRATLDVLNVWRFPVDVYGVLLVSVARGIPDREG